MRKRAASLAAAGAIVLVLAGCSTGGGASPNESAGSEDWLEELEPITLTWADPQPEETAPGQAMVAFMDYIEEQTEGKVTFERFFAGSLVPGPEVLSAVESGVADAGDVSSVAFFAEDLPVSNWVQGFGIVPRDQGTLGAIAMPLAANEFYSTNEAIQSEFEGQGVKAFGSASYVYWSLICSKEVGTPEEVAAARISVPGGMQLKQVDALGATTQYVDTLEVYEALQRGTIDCHTNPLNAYSALGFWEPAKFVTPINLAANTGTTMPVLNLDIWNSFPSELQQIFEDAGQAYVKGFISSVLDYYAVSVGEGESEQGVTFVDPADINEELDPWNEDEMKRLVDQAPSSVSDPQGMFDEFQSLVEKWTGILEEEGVEPLEDFAQWSDNVVNGPDAPYQAAIQQVGK